MPRLTAEQWAKIRHAYEAGETGSSLARRFPVTRAAIRKRAEKEGWTQDVEPVIRRMVAEKVAGLVPGATSEKKAEAMSQEASRRAAVVERHKREWDDHQRLIEDAINRGDFEAAKLAKITSETIRIRQDGERKAWSLDDNSLKIDVTRASDAELEVMVKGKG
jgi:hypothetical protein